MPHVHVHAQLNLLLCLLDLWEVEYLLFLLSLPPPSLPFLLVSDTLEAEESGEFRMNFPSDISYNRNEICVHTLWKKIAKIHVHLYIG